MYRLASLIVPVDNQIKIVSVLRVTLAEQRLELLEAGNNDEEIAELEERVSETEDLLKKNKEEALVIDEEIAIVEKALSEITIPDRKSTV